MLWVAHTYGKMRQDNHLQAQFHHPFQYRKIQYLQTQVSAGRDVGHLFNIAGHNLFLWQYICIAVDIGPFSDY